VAETGYFGEAGEEDEDGVGSLMCAVPAPALALSVNASNPFEQLLPARAL
jgi:hypothetical protein